MTALPARRWRVGRLALYVEPRDAWIGVYVAPDAVYVCPLPFLVAKWTRRVSRCGHTPIGFRPGIIDCVRDRHGPDVPHRYQMNGSSR